MSIDPAVHAALRLCLATLFAAAGLHKLRTPLRFRAALDAYEVLPQRSVNAAASALPFGEALIAVSLLYTPAAGFAAVAALALLCVYTGAIAVNLRRGRRDLDCGCGAAEAPQPIGPSLLLRNLALMACASAVAVGPGDRPLHATDALTITGASLVAALLWTATTRLGALRPLNTASRGWR
jgi:hypothetical protein